MKIFMVGEAARYGDRLAEGLEASLRKRTEIVALPREAAYSGAFDRDIRRGDIVISLKLKREDQRLPPFRLLHVPGAGLDGIDFSILSEETTVLNVFEHDGPISEFVIASLLHWEIRFDELRRSFDPQNWSDVYRNRVPHEEIAGKTLGLMGFGRIGRAIAVRAKALGMRILAVDALPSPSELAEEVLPPEHVLAVLEAADYFVVSCPLTPQTRGMIGESELSRMKTEAVVVNVSRAEIIEEAPLYQALRTKRIRGASLDVWYRYPSGEGDRVQPADHPFHELPNTVCTPHASAWTRELMDRRYDAIARNINALHNGTALQNVVRAGRQSATPEA